MRTQKRLVFSGRLIRLSDGAFLDVSGYADDRGPRLLSSDVNRFCSQLWQPLSARLWEPRELIVDLVRPAGFLFEPSGRWFWSDVSLPGVGFVRCRRCRARKGA